VLLAGEIMVKGIGPDRIEVIRVLADSEATEKRLVSARLDDVIRAIVELGGGYNDVLAVLQEARAKNHLTSRLAVDALPKPGRRYYGDDSQEETADGDAVQYAGPLPELFRTGNEPAGGTISDEPESVLEESAESERGFFGRIGEWLSPW
jgi:hypothetical protein